MSGLAARQLSLPPLPLEEPSENEPSENAGAGALQLLGRRPEDAGADAGSALAENAARSTPITPPPLPRNQSWQQATHAIPWK